MTLRLILIRHAKSDWDDPLLSDHDRPLNARGRKNAPQIRGWLMDRGYRPDMCLCSTAKRAAETWSLIGSALPEPVVTDFTGRLYHAGPDTMLSVLRGADATSVAMVGHNPGIASFAHRLCKSPPAHPRFSDYPTAATTIIDFTADLWSDVTWSSGTATDFVIPREL